MPTVSFGRVEESLVAERLFGQHDVVVAEQHRFAAASFFAAVICGSFLIDLRIGNV